MWVVPVICLSIIDYSKDDDMSQKIITSLSLVDLLDLNHHVILQEDHVPKTTSNNKQSPAKNGGPDSNNSQVLDFSNSCVGLEGDSSPVEPGGETSDLANPLKQRNKVSLT